MRVRGFYQAMGYTSHFMSQKINTKPLSWYLVFSKLFGVFIFFVALVHTNKWGWVKTLVPSEHQNSWDLWMLKKLKMVFS